MKNSLENVFLTINTKIFSYLKIFCANSIGSPTIFINCATLLPITTLLAGLTAIAIMTYSINNNNLKNVAIQK